MNRRGLAVRTGLASLLSLFALAGPGAAQDAREWRLYVENDKFDFLGDNSDRYYTNGLRLEIPGGPQTLESAFLPGVTHDDWCRLLCGDAAEEDVVAGFSVGQNMYTPAIITIARPQPYDRPWAGLAYVSRFAAARSTDRALGLQVQRQDRLEATLGVVGPASLAGPTQIEWHRLFGWDHPAGWDNQLRNEPVLQLQYATARRWPPDDGGHFDVIPRVRANAGNALVSLEAEATVRIGWNLAGFGPTTSPMAPPPPPLLRGEGLAGSGGGRWLRSANLFARAGVKAVAHSIFLDGNTFASNDIRIERTPIVSEWAAGVEANLVGPLWLSYQYVERSSEFTSPLGGKAPGHRFGSMTFAYRKAL